ncbi:carboxylesterase/lipase family protein [Biostraticola tofi]|uniref:Carboxylic ester hydrolase n=1 Tax=Biostraticola tofi TaxID=466109 RepID=A0A4R3YM84_9GAMM|nr:carboxylesterase family protein [Biostraticola tofi]TCV93727.1 para-nitrobenzyl esterase [Biostraticola tofi]
MTIIQTQAGRLAGIDRQGISEFLNVPYAAPVVAANRYLAPEPVIPWSGIRDAGTLGSICPQIPTYGPVGHAATSSLAAGSDFRTLNIRTRSMTGQAPVLVWIHGGGYAVGSANEPVLQSGAFAASGVVEVTVNYRLGALGFLHLEGYPANRGLLDIIAALGWVRDNISAFGGDPSRVTLAGRSAGGFAVAALMAMPAARGLFARALPQSGASTGISTLDDSHRLTERLCQWLNIDKTAIVGLPLETLLQAQKHLCDQSYTEHDFARDGNVAMLGVPFVPVIDGHTLPEHPEQAAQAGRLAPVPMMIGCTSSEYLTHATAQPEMDDAMAARLLDERVRPLGLSGSEIVARYRQVLPTHSARGIWRAVGGDLVFQNPASRLARLHAEFQPVWKYLYGSIDADELGAAHGTELGHVWYREGSDISQLPARQAITDLQLAREIHQLWVTFIRDESPAPPHGMVWPRYNTHSPLLLHLVTGGVFEVCADPFFPRLALWRR